MKRREFVYISSLVIAGCAMPVPFRHAKESKRLLLQPYEDLAEEKFGIFCLNFENSKMSHLETRFSVHSIFYDEFNDEYIGVNKYGPEYLKFKRFTQNDLKYFKVDESGIALSGHVSSRAADENYYLTGVSSQTNKSCLIALNKKTNITRIVSEVGQYDPPVHDCKLSHSTGRIVFTGSNQIHSLDLITLKQVSQKIALKTPHSSLRHFEVNEKNEYCLQSNIIHTRGDYIYESAEVVFHSDKGTEAVRINEVSSDLSNNELLDFSFSNDQKSFACVHGKSKFLSIWSSNPLKFVKLIKFDNRVRRVSNYFNEDQYLVMSSDGFYLVDQNSYKVTKVSKFHDILKNSYSYSHKTLVNRA